METDTKSSGTTYDVDARRAKEGRVRLQSERYARTWCLEHAKDVGCAFRDLKGPPMEITVRVYDREKRAIRDTTLGDVLDAIPYEDGFMKVLRPTAFGQVAINPNMHISVGIYQLLLTTWTAVTSCKPV